MGGKRIAEQVRRALIVAAKVAPVTVLIDASGCGSASCAVICQISRPPVPDGGTADLVLPVVPLHGKPCVNGWGSDYDCQRICGGTSAGDYMCWVDCAKQETYCVSPVERCHAE